MNEVFQRNLLLSLAAHIILACLIFLRTVLIPDQPLEIRNAIRVDIVGLPDKITEPDAPLPPKPETPPKEEIKEVPKAPEKAVKETVVEKASPSVNLSKTKKKDAVKDQKKAFEKLNQMSAIDKIKGEVNKAKDTKAQPVIKGNVVSEGNSLTGLERIDYDRYLDDIKSKILTQWNLPTWLADGNYRAQVLVLIDERGFVTKKVIRQSSGNDVFDAKVIEAVESSSPLPPPPQRLRGVLSSSGIIFNFPE